MDQHRVQQHETLCPKSILHEQVLKERHVIHYLPAFLLQTAFKSACPVKGIHNERRPALKTFNQKRVAFYPGRYSQSFIGSNFL